MNRACIFFCPCMETNQVNKVYHGVKCLMIVNNLVKSHQTTMKTMRNQSSNQRQVSLYRVGCRVRCIDLNITVCVGVWRLQSYGVMQRFKGDTVPLTATASATTCVNSPGHACRHSATLDRLPCKHALRSHRLSGRLVLDWLASAASVLRASQLYRNQNSERTTRRQKYRVGWSSLPR